jgi:LuxR family transcriptional regulator of csgAB operon
VGAELPVTSAIERSVLILGSHSLQNKLLAKLIGERTGYPCEMRPYERLSRSGTPPLVLIDSGECTEQLPTLCASGLFPSIAIINVPVINADAPMHAEEVISYPGIKGVFCADVSEDQLIRGIEAIFDGQYWLPRRLLCLHLERTRMRVEPPVAAGMLTRKELQTLRLLATGNSTEHIAAELKVSPHTVKTHIYNLFRKINVSNRLQAVHWAARHMPGVEIAGPR